MSENAKNESGLKRKTGLQGLSAEFSENYLADKSRQSLRQTVVVVIVTSVILGAAYCRY